MKHLKDTIRNYRNTIILNFSEGGSNFSLDVPHYKKWLCIILFLRKRGFKIGENPTYKEHYDSLSKYHKLGYKKDVACLVEISSSRIVIEFGNIQNLWKDMKQAFWDNPKDSRYTPLSYLEDLAVKLEIKKLMDYCKKFGHKFIVEDDDLSPEEFIINKLKKNTHIHGEVECLEDIRASITEDSYDFCQNSNDKNKKKIICGDTKYFYDYYTKRLFCGVVWHNINNMWWVIAGGTLRNIASHDLFDFEPGLLRRKPVEKRRMSEILKTYENKRDYKKCMMIKNYADKIFSFEKY